MFLKKKKKQIEILINTSFWYKNNFNRQKRPDIVDHMTFKNISNNIKNR